MRVPLIDVGHLAGVELDVGAADADPLDVDEQLARGAATGSGTSSTAACARCGDDERAHQLAAVGSGDDVLGLGAEPRDAERHGLAAVQVHLRATGPCRRREACRC